MKSFSSSHSPCLELDSLILTAQGEGPDSEAAKTELVSRFNPLIHSWVKRVCQQHHLDEHTCRMLHDDMVQSGWLGFFKALAHFDSSCGSTLGFFAKRFIENEIQHTLRSYHLYTSRTITDESGERAEESELERSAVRAGDVTLEQVVLSDIHNSLAEFLYSLPPRQREYLIEVYLGRSQAQLARARQISKAAVNRDFCLIRQRAQVQLGSRSSFQQ